MEVGNWFPDLPDDFEESVRIDREEQDHRLHAIRSYHLTEDSQRFVRDFMARLLGRTEDMRTGSNYWLYGYYGSGKSHLLTVLDGLLDSTWATQEPDYIWDELVDGVDDRDVEEIRDHWRDVHDETHIIPVSVNLLKYQGQRQRSFSEIILRHAHQDPELTGVDDEISEGLSPRLSVAYFERWFKTTKAWPDREDLANEALDEITDGEGQEWRSENLWEDVQEYEALADVILPKLFEDVNGTRDGFQDLTPSDLNSEEVISRLEELRRNREEELDQPVKLILLLDEVSLFIGTDFERLTELQALAEGVNKIGDGDIQLVATAQAAIEDVQPKFAAHGADFSIVKDRFRHRYQLPSKHVGEIAKHRLLNKSDAGRRDVQDIIDQASVKPPESLVYSETKQNTTPPLDSIDEDELVEFYPFLPYHGPLFLEILFNLRQEASDSAKSIFSGTARAILALIHSLLQRWIEQDTPDQVISLVDLYELIKPELREILEDDMRVIEGSEATTGIKDEVEEGSLDEFDLRVAKAILLLQHVDDMIPLTAGNIAVSVMSDLNGRSRINIQNRVEESLDRMEKFIRPVGDEESDRYRFATQEERLIYQEVESNEADPNWDGVIRALDKHLWEEVLEDLSLPESVPYGSSGEEYPLGYNFRVDGMDLVTEVQAEGGLQITLEVQGVRPDETPERTEEDILYWSIGDAGLGDLRTHLVKWWALQEAADRHVTRPTIEQELDRRADAVRRKLTGALQNGSFSVKDQSGLTSTPKAVRTAVEVVYPDDFHPVMLQVRENRLAELADLDQGDPLPTWANEIQVPSPGDTSGEGRKRIQNNVKALTARQLEGETSGLNLETILDTIASEKPFYADARPALCAILWGFCRIGQFVPVDEEGRTLEDSTILDLDRTSTTRLKLLPREPIGKLLQDGGFKETTETVAQGLINLQEENENIRSTLTGLREDARLILDTEIQSEAIGGLLESLIQELSQKIEQTEDRLEMVRDQGEGLRDAIRDTNQTRQQTDEIVDVWNRRLTTLYRFDLQLTLATEGFEWIDDETQYAVAEQRKSIEAYEGPWWTNEGWKALVDGTATNLDTKLQRAWASYTDAQGLTTFVDRIRDHSWLRPPRELPNSVQIAFEQEHLAPMRRVKRWYETLDDAVSSLDSEDEDELVSAISSVSRTDPFDDAGLEDIKSLSARLDRLSEILGERSPEDVDQIGVLPDDRRSLDRRIERLVEERDLQADSTDGGVVIR